ncbi:MAG: dipeptidase [Acidobacteriota bacterium]|nr:dipeptidase [Acidobacteriota bacterium]
MRVKLFVIPLLLLATAAMAQSPAKKHAASKSTAKAAQSPRSVHQSALVIDTHADTPGRFVDENFDPASDAGKGHWDLAKVKQGNLGAEFFSIWVDPERYKDHATRRALDMIDAVYEMQRQHPDQVMMAYSVKDIEAAHRQHKLAALLGVEGGHALEGDLRVLRDFYRLGVRYMTLTWANSNELGQSSGDVQLNDKGKPKDPGLTDLGREAVREMNRMGMMVDISHVSDRSFYHALVVSRAPVIASHSSARAVTNVPRNMTDDMLVALARNGGVAQVNFYCGFISDEYNARAKAYETEHADAVQRARELWQAPRTPANEAELARLQAARDLAVPRPPLSALIDHFDHMIKVAGVDHVGIGSDFDGVECLPEGIDGVQDLPKITEELMKRGYSADDMTKILGGNLLRVFAEVERVSGELQKETNPDQRPELAAGKK